MRKIQSLLGSLFFFSAIFLFLDGCNNNGSKSSSQSSIPIFGQNKTVKAPPFTLRDLSGNDVSLESLKGQVVLLDFWATWCPPCRISIPALKKIHEQYKDQGLSVVGISLDENPSTVPPFVKNQGMTYTVLQGGNSDVSELYGVRSIPTFFILDQNGDYVRHWMGFDYSFPDEWRKSIDQLLLASS